MLSFAPALIYAITDIETTGGNAQTGKITEIAVYLHNGYKIIDSYETLVNPGVPIPPYITKLTGISDDMVSDAPDFEAVAAKLDAFTANAVFVAHNVHFDYGFIREEFRRTGRDFNRKKLCTVQLSRSTFPGLASYSLDKITGELNIVLDGHHRAAADAKATAFLFERIVQKHSEQGLFDAHFGIPNLTGISSPYIDEDFLRSIPDEPGVVRFYDAADTLIYSKRSANVLTTICDKLKHTEAKDAALFRDALHRIDYQLTGSQLLAQLLEADDVISLKPEFNHGRFSMKARYACVIEHIKEVPHAVIKKRRNGEDAAMLYTSFFEGRDHLNKLAEEWGISLRDVTIGRRPFPSLPLENESMMMQGISPLRGRLVLTDEGRRASERTLIYIESGAVLGYGYYDNDFLFSGDPSDEMQVAFTPHAELELVARKFIEKGRFESLKKV